MQVVVAVQTVLWAMRNAGVAREILADATECVPQRPGEDWGMWLARMRASLVPFVARHRLLLGRKTAARQLFDGWMQLSQTVQDTDVPRVLAALLPTLGRKDQTFSKMWADAEDRVATKGSFDLKHNEADNGLEQLRKQCSVAVVGAGAAGLAVLSALAKLPADLDEVELSVTCFDQMQTPGGWWHQPRRQLQWWSSLPKEAFEFPDFPFEQHFGRSAPSFLPADDVWHYLLARTNNATQGGLSRIRLGHAVRWVAPLPTGQLGVTVEDVVSGEARTRAFDYVVVATGRQPLPRYELFQAVPGLDAFPGPVVHEDTIISSRGWPASVLDQCVMVLVSGCTPTPVDHWAPALAAHMLRAGAASVVMAKTATTESGPGQARCCQGMRQHPGHSSGILRACTLVRLQDNTALFADGSSARLDVVVVCNGYRQQASFLAPELRATDTTSMHSPPSSEVPGQECSRDTCANSCTHPLFVGREHPWLGFALHDAEALAARSFVLRSWRRKQAGTSLQAATSNAWNADEGVGNQHELRGVGDGGAGCGFSNVDCAVKTQAARVARLLSDLSDTETTADWNVPGVLNLALQSNASMWCNPLAFRDERYPSLRTQELAPQPPIPWFSNMRDIISPVPSKL
eukprot:m.228840 g.228840  ORF g.228840 m.228840 type:complete len:631 (-) comp18833_c0_seq6:13-1905(-)